MKIKVNIRGREIELPVAEARRLYLELAEVFAVKKKTVIPAPPPAYEPPIYIGPIVVPAPQYPAPQEPRFTPYGERIEITCQAGTN